MLEDTWRELEEAPAPPGTPGLAERRLEVSDFADVHLAATKPGNERMLLVGVAWVPPAPLGALRDTLGMSIRIAVSIQPPPQTTIEVHLTEPRFREVFTALVEDLVTAITKAADAAGVVQQLLGRLARWQRFLQEAGSTGLGWEKQRGLYGELWFLRFQLLGTIAGDAACDAWTGPLGTHQDFQFRSCAVEVKTTGTNQPQRVRIASERQLDETGVERLYLFHLSVDARTAAGESLPQMVDAVRRALGEGPGRETFEDRLMSAGYSDVHRTLYDRTGFTRRESHLFSVREGFPRITEADLSPGVGDVNYSLTISDLFRFEVDEVELREQITRPVGDV